MNEAVAHELPPIEQHRRHIEAALGYGGGTHTFDDITAGVAVGTLHYFPGADSAIVAELIQYPRSRAVNFFLAGGNLAELEAMTPLVLEWAKLQGCTAATFTGRRGWERTFLGRTGWAFELVVARKSL